MTDAAFTPIGVVQPPNLSTVDINALGDGPQGAMFYDTTTESFSVIQKNMLKRLNQPYHVSGYNTSQSITAYSSYTLNLALDKKGYTGGFVFCRSPAVVNSATGKASTFILVRPGISTGVLASIHIDNYSSGFNSAAGESQFSETCYASDGTAIIVSNCYMASDGGSINIIFSNSSSSSKTLSVYVAGWVF